MDQKVFGKYNIYFSVDMAEDGKSFEGNLSFPDSLTQEQVEIFMSWWLMKSQTEKFRKQQKEKKQKIEKMTTWQKIKYFITH